MPRHKLVGIGASACLTLASVSLALSPTSAHAATPAAVHPAVHPATVAAAGGWVATHTLALTPKGTALGHAPSRQQMRVTVALPMRNTAGIDARIASMGTPGSADYGHFLTPAQVRATYGPSTATVSAVTDYLHREGFTSVSASPNRILIDATGSVAQVERAFDTHIGLFSIKGHQVFANTVAASVPAALGSDVVAVLGLSSLQMNLPITVHRPQAARPATTAAGAPVLSGFYPAQIAKVYHATQLPAASKTQVAVVAIGNMAPIIKNLRIAEKAEKFARAKVKVVYTDPKYALNSPNTLTGNAEWDLDVQMSTMEAKKPKRLDIYDIATFTDSDVTRAFNKFVSDDKAKTLSASLGECDSLAYLDGSMVTTDEVLSQGALQGQSAFASTGDNGSFCPEGASTGVPGGGPGQSWPAIGEYTTAVGGTTLVADAQGNVTSEIAWVGGGGGISTYGTAAPWTQQANVAGQLANENNFGGRGVPDIASDADSNTGVLIYTGGTKPEVVGGTSVSSPTVSGLWARVDNAHHDKLGLAQYRIYQLYNKTNPATIAPGLTPTYVPNANPAHVKGFRDIKAGANGAYTAVPGYDYTTGVGAPLAWSLFNQL